MATIEHERESIIASGVALAILFLAGARMR
jgi:hypothetical protein